MHWLKNLKTDNIGYKDGRYAGNVGKAVKFGCA